MHHAARFDQPQISLVAWAAIHADLGKAAMNSADLRHLQRPPHLGRPAFFTRLWACLHHAAHAAHVGHAACGGLGLGLFGDHRL
ncbi:hypothetical protein, partial [Paracoccus sp. (in: a-proteobacteria)]|uniref:hypothetical protein n=2 Tax=Paracoccus TaxID=265 RepID=UPI002588700D